MPERTLAQRYPNLAAFLMLMTDPPDLPVAPGEELVRFRPAPGFLDYLKMGFWIGLTPTALGINAGLLILSFVQPLAGIPLLLLADTILLSVAVLGYLTLLFKCEHTWYVLSPRSIRIRRGVWSITEQTVTFENVQNVSVSQGPLQRAFGIASVCIQTAGGGMVQAGNQQVSMPNQGVIEGVDNAERVREMVMARVRRSRQSGLGDDDEPDAAPTPGWTPAHLAALREIRDAAAILAKNRA
jgi:membrane protein YdbS with pleckstrin-like domain